jgi:hypothetical protein
MPFELEIKEMVEALTEGIGARLGRSVRSSFFKLAERLMRYEEFIKMERPFQQMTLDLLALSIFYNEIISPLEGGHSFVSLAEKSKASHIRIGSDKLTHKFVNSASSCVRNFYSILHKNDIPLNLLSFSSLNCFIDNIKDSLERRQHETVD